MMLSKKVSFIGLGEMGVFMAKNLVEKGFELTVYDMVKKPVKELQALGAKSAATCKEAAEASDVIIIMVRDDPQIDQVVYGKDGVWEGVKGGSFLIISSTVDPLHCQRIATEGEKKRVRVLDAPVSGAWIGAKAGTLTFMIGGDRGAFEECRPVFEAMGKNLFYLGGSGMGEVSKLVNNFIMSINLATLSEGLGLACRAGLDPETFIKVVQASTGASWYAQNWELAKEHVGDYCQGKKEALWFAFSKDMGLALKLAKDVGQLVPLGGLFSQLDPFRFFPRVERSFYDYGYCGY